MSEYTPTTDEVRASYSWDRVYGSDDRDESRIEFDRWLAQVKAEVWDEGFLLATRNNPNKPHPMLSYNPYREEGS